MSASHSFWKSESIPGMEVAAAGRGLTEAPTLSGSRSEAASSSPVTGHRPPDDSSAFSMSDFSKRWPLLLLTTGTSGVVLEIAQNIAEQQQSVQPGRVPR